MKAIAKKASIFFNTPFIEILVSISFQVHPKMNIPSLPPQPSNPYQEEDGRTQQPAPASIPEDPEEIKPSFPRPYPENPVPSPDKLQS
ncbi:hypothetical protein [Pulveribacter sp.]|uniref:hypothetical protein n=1 Tax=Pulveribacter sp. TaxID=2678893 RepID=UPI00289CCB86|nr:hypothetical protein [Pulveribacter sp.]